MSGTDAGKPAMGTDGAKAPTAGAPDQAGETKYSGHMTMADGSHVRLSPEEAAQLWRNIEAEQAEIAARYPDEKSCLTAMSEAFHRLKDFGWSDAMYCPKDGSSFHVIEAGSTGIHDCHYQGEWPTGSWWISEAGDLYPSYPILYKTKAAGKPAEGSRAAALPPTQPTKEKK